MLPPAWREMDPQRVCADCFYALRPIQEEMVETNSNALRANALDESGPWRYVNRPLNFSLGGELRKAAYSLQNLIDGLHFDNEHDLARAKLISEVKGAADRKSVV